MTNKENPIYDAFSSEAAQLMEHLEELQEFESSDTFLRFMEAASTNHVVLFPYGTGTYDKHRQQFSKFNVVGTQRPFGIQVHTLSENTKLILYPQTAFSPDEEMKQEAASEGLEVNEDQPQALVYFLDGSAEEIGNIPTFTANLLFVAHLSEALRQGLYPLKQAELSTEFQMEIEKALALVRDYITFLPQEKRKQITDEELLTISLMEEERISNYAKDIAQFRTESMKPPGLVTSDTPSGRIDFSVAAEAIETGSSLLHLTKRRLPQRSTDREDTPILPWVEYGRNRYDRNHSLFGRYELNQKRGTTRVDYRLNSSNFPGRYGFFEALEISEERDGKKTVHIIFGQNFTHELNPESVYPDLVAGDTTQLDFITNDRLALLTQDEGTKIEIARVLTDILTDINYLQVDR